MSVAWRRLFPYLVFVAAIAAVAWAASFGTLPPAEFTFVNDTEIQSIDPAKVTGAPEGRIINAVFEGLYRAVPVAGEDGAGDPQPALAERHTLSEDQRTYTFHLRPEARWSDGAPLTAADFVWSWRRFLHPETASEYAYQLHYVVGGRAYNAGEVAPGARVEVELDDRPRPDQQFPSGTIVRGVLREILVAARPEETIYRVEVKRVRAGRVDWRAPGTLRSFTRAAAAEVPGRSGPAERCRHVLPDFDSQVGIRAVDQQTLVVTLDHPTPYFLHLVAFYPLYPVPRQCVERHGSPQWTRPENLVQSGPYQIAFRRIRDRIRLVRNPRYWNASAVQLEVIDALAVNSATTNLNMYLNGEVDWIASVPNAMIPQLRQRADFLTAPMLTTYFYRVNVTRPPLDDRRVRAALNLAIDKRQICEAVTRGGQVPARGFVPPGIAGYHGAQTGEFDVPQARRLLAEAGYPGGRGLRKLQLLYNTSEAHQDIAEVVQQQWKSHLGIDVELRNLEWGVYLDAVTKREYDIARAGWIGDYPDPNTFLDMFVTGGTNNQTGWGDARYDQLIREAQTTPDPHTRLAQLAEAETILMRELPILPIYFYVSINMVRPYVKGFAANILDVHPLHLLEVDAEEKDRVLSGEGLR